MKKKSDNQKALDRSLEDIDKWDIITLMTYMKNEVMHHFDKDRNAILRYHLCGYDDSALSNLDKVRDQFERVYSREFDKVYNQVKEANAAKNQIQNLG